MLENRERETQRLHWQIVWRQAKTGSLSTTRSRLWCNFLVWCIPPCVCAWHTFNTGWGGIAAWHGWRHDDAELETKWLTDVCVRCPRKYLPTAFFPNIARPYQPLSWRFGRRTGYSGWLYFSGDGLDRNTFSYEQKKAFFTLHSAVAFLGTGCLLTSRPLGGLLLVLSSIFYFVLTDLDFL